MYTAVAEADALGLKHIERAGEMGDHRVDCRIAGAFPLAHRSPREARACRQVFHGEIGERATRAQLIAGDSDCQHEKNSAQSGESVNANKNSRTYAVPTGSERWDRKELSAWKIWLPGPD